MIINFEFNELEFNKEKVLFYVDIDEDEILNEISDDDIQNEAEDRGLMPAEIDIGDFSDSEIQNEYEERNLDFRKTLIEDLLLDYYTLSSEQFQKSLKKFFFKSIDEYIR